MIFLITQILRKINVGDSRRAKSAISTHLEPLFLTIQQNSDPQNDNNGISFFLYSRIPIKSE